MPKDTVKDKLEHGLDEVKQGLKDLGDRMGDLGVGADATAPAGGRSGYRLPRPEPSSSGGRSVDSMTKDEWYAEAKRLDVKGRSNMTKAELAEAVENS
jgi:hypothetical protein